MIVAFPSRDPEMRAVGARVRALRERRGLGCEALAVKIGVARERLERAERGLERLTSTELYRVTMVLRISMRLLFEDGPRDWPSA